jgi:hypothetical protein
VHDLRLRSTLAQALTAAHAISVNLIGPANHGCAIDPEDACTICFSTSSCLITLRVAHHFDLRT